MEESSGWTIAYILYWAIIPLVAFGLPLCFLFSFPMGERTQLQWVVFGGTQLIAFLSATSFRIVSALFNGAPILSTNAHSVLKTPLDISPFPDIPLTIVCTTFIYFFFIMLVPDVSRSRRLWFKRWYGIVSIVASSVLFTAFGIAAMWLVLARDIDVLSAPFIALLSVYLSLSCKVYWLREVGQYDFVPEPLIRQFRDDYDYYKRYALYDKKYTNS